MGAEGLNTQTHRHTHTHTRRACVSARFWKGEIRRVNPYAQRENKRERQREDICLHVSVALRNVCTHAPHPQNRNIHMHVCVSNPMSTNLCDGVWLCVYVCLCVNMHISIQRCAYVCM